MCLKILVYLISTCACGRYDRPYNTKPRGTLSSNSMHNPCKLHVELGKGGTQRRCSKTQSAVWMTNDRNGSTEVKHQKCSIQDNSLPQESSNGMCMAGRLEIPMLWYTSFRALFRACERGRPTYEGGRRAPMGGATERLAFSTH